MAGLSLLSVLLLLSPSASLASPYGGRPHESTPRDLPTSPSPVATSTTAAPSTLLPSSSALPPLSSDAPVVSAYGVPSMDQPSDVTEKTSTTAPLAVSSSVSPYAPALLIARKVIATDTPTTAAPSTFNYVLNEEAARKYWATASFTAETTTSTAPASDRPFLLVDETMAPSIIVEKPASNSYGEPTKPSPVSRSSTAAPSTVLPSSSALPVLASDAPIVSAYGVPSVDQQMAIDVSSTLAPPSLDTATTAGYHAESTTSESVLSTPSYGKPVIVPQADIPAVGALLQKMGEGSPAPFIVIIVPPSILEHIKQVTSSPAQDAESKPVSEYETVSTTSAPSTFPARDATTTRGYQESTTSSNQQSSSSSSTESLDLPKTTSTTGKY